MPDAHSKEKVLEALLNELKAKLATAKIELKDNLEFVGREEVSMSKGYQIGLLAAIKLLEKDIERSEFIVRLVEGEIGKRQTI